MNPERLFLSTTPGIEAALEAEARALFGEVRLTAGGVEVEGPQGLHQEACLRLRTASHVLLRVSDWPAADLRAFEAGLRGADLRPFLRGPPKLEVSVRRSPLRAREVGAAAARALGAGEGDLRLLLRVEGDRASLSVDCAGELLHRRGYRQEISRAPLRETLAAGMLLLAGYGGAVPLWDPMCGSGTLVIEGALIARRRAPGIDRRFAFEGWPSFDAAAWDARRARARAEERSAPAAIRGSDLNAGSLGVARRNARRAGVLDAIALERKDALQLAPDGAPGLLAANLPYGKRVGGDADLVALHRSLGEQLRSRFRGWRVALLVGSPGFEEALSLPGARGLDVDNGGLRCRLILAEIP